MAIYLGKKLIQSAGGQYIKKGDNISELTNDSNFITKDDLTSDFAGKIDTGSLGTINGQSIENGNNVTIDLSLFKVVTELPTAPAEGDENKIFLLPATDNTTGNIYIEYIFANEAWEKLGEYKSEVDLSGYLKSEDAASTYLTISDAESNYAKTADLPTKVSDFENDSKFIQSSDETITNIVYLTLAEYNSLGDSTDDKTLYIVSEEATA